MISTTTMSSDEKTYSRTAEYRKIVKPMVERKRRARINKSLSLLKSIILDVVKKDGCQYSKLEKADILEMTVGHLHELRQQKQTVKPADCLDKFRDGFVQCASDVTKYLCQESCDSALRERLISHLHGCIEQLDRFQATPAISQPSPMGNAYHQPLCTPPTSPVSLSSSSFCSLSPPLPCNELSTKPVVSPMSKLSVHMNTESPVWRPWS